MSQVASPIRQLIAQDPQAVQHGRHPQTTGHAAGEAEEVTQVDSVASA
jgi:hypothetical protein